MKVFIHMSHVLMLQDVCNLE